jgi:hypothetical protein
VAETAISITTLGVEDPELGPSPRRPVPTPRDERLRPLADDVAAEPDPGLPLELEPQSRRLRDGGGEPARESGRLERDEERLGPACETGEPPQAIRDLRLRRPDRRAYRQIDHEDVDRAAREKHPGDRQALVERLGCQHDEPVESDAAGRRLDRIERPREVEPGDDRAVGLRLRSESQGERRCAR